MKKLAIIQFSVLAIVSGFVTWLTFLTGGIAAYHWSEVFFAGEVKAPAITIFAARYGYLLPLICCLASIICLVVSMRKSENIPHMWRLFTFIATIELISLALVSLINFFPALRIMYRLM